jgi:hypothetical protein
VKPVLAIAVCLAALPFAASIASPADDGSARRCATHFGNALSSANASALRAILPARGKVQVDLDRLGPEEGSFSAGQVEALFHAFLKRGRVDGFEVLRIDDDRTDYAMAHVRATLLDPSTGRRTQVDVRLAMQPEGDGWVLREIRESPR